MNKPARKHLERAKDYLAKGEEFYRKAGKEMAAAKEADPTLTYQEMGEWFGRSESWAHAVAQAATPQRAGDEGFAVNWGSGSNKRTDVTRTTLAQAPLEHVEQIVASLPKDRQQAIVAAAGSPYHKARQEYDETEAALTPAERNERELAKEQITRPVRLATATFATLGIVGHLEQALEELRELNADASVSLDAARKIEQALDAFTTEFDFARAMLGERTDT